MKIQKHVKVELMRKKAARPIEAVQYDTGNQVIFEIVDFDLPTGTKATLYVQKPSGKFVYQEDEITIAGNNITVNLHNQALTEHGKIYYQVRLENGADLITTFTGIMFVEKSLADAGATESTTVLAAFAELTAEKIAEIQAVAAASTTEMTSELQAVAQDERDAIEDKGLEVLNTIPADYIATAATAEKAIREKAPAIVCGAEGKNIVIADSSDDHVRGLKLFGKTEQVKTTGKNLLPNTASSKTENGVTVTVNDDGSISFSGTATGYAGVPIYEGDVSVFPDVITVLALGTFTNVVLHIVLVDKSGSTILETNLTSATPYRTIDFSQYENIERITINAKRYTTGVVSGTVYPMVVSGKVDSAEYEPYSGGAPSPSPNYPQELVSVGDSGSIGVSVCGKNLLPNEAVSKTVNGVTFTVNVDGSITANGTATNNSVLAIVVRNGLADRLQTGVEYILSGTPAGGSMNTFRLKFLNTDGNGKSVHDVGTGVNFEFTNDSEYYNAAIVVNAGVTVSNIVFYPMIRLASIADDTYEPYKGSTLTALPVPNGLPGIPVSSGGNYTDADGQMWICDEVDFERGVYVQRVLIESLSKYTFTQYSIAAITVGCIGYYSTITNRLFGTTTFASMIRCSHFVNSESNWVNTHENQLRGDKSSPGVQICVNATEFPAASDFNAWVAENDVQIIYPLAIPIETPLSAETIAAYRALHTNKPNTTVFNDAGAHMAVDYNADTKLYIDNKFATIAAAMVNNV